MSAPVTGTDPQATSVQHAHVMSNGRYAVLLTRDGGGFSARDGRALTRWCPDPLGGSGGFHAYLRDLDDGRYWSAAPEPVRRPAGRQGRFPRVGSVGWLREVAGIESRFTVRVAADCDAELRRITLWNIGTRTRRIELTTYAEVVLEDPAADAAHPAFSKLFVQTAAAPAAEALLAWRRQRSPAEPPLWLAHRLWLEQPDAAISGLTWETDRARFLGRGRTRANPYALACGAPLSGTAGNVLDPIVAMRRAVVLEPGRTVTFLALLAAGDCREDVLAVAYDMQVTDAREYLWSNEAPVTSDAGALGLPPAWRARLRITTDADEAPVSDRSARRPCDSASERSRPEAALLSSGAPADDEPAPSDPFSASPPAYVPDATSGSGPDLLCFNGYGGFTHDGSEYVIRIAGEALDRALPPQPWINVIANARAGVLASERGALHTWAENSRENRLTPWSNDPVSDPHGEALYVRDEDGGAFWSPTPGPVPARAPYEVRHGFGYTRYTLNVHGLAHDVCVFVPKVDPLRIVRVAVRNAGASPRRLSVFSYARLVLGSLPAATRGHVVTSIDDATGAVFATNPERGEFAHRVAFAAAVFGGGVDLHVTADRTAFLGESGEVSRPAALVRAAKLDGVVGAHLDPCVAFQCTTTIRPGATFTSAFLLGEAESAEEARSLVRRFASLDAIERARNDVTAAWRDLLSGIRIATPSPAIDLMVNGWLPYQDLSCRMLARTALYQSGGAFGFRDQLQDAAALVYLDPALTRRQIVLHAAHQFVAGDVLHWWHPPTGKGIRTRFSDDLLWLPYITAFYIGCTGDASILDDTVRFISSPPLPQGEDEVFVMPEDRGERATVFDHCCRALDRSLTRGAHGLPLMGAGDWNDGMNRVGREGRGESVWLGFFLYDILGDFIQICERRADAERAHRYRVYRADLHAALEDGGWDGAWYRRAYDDDGSPLGSAANDECRIDAIAQAWAVLSGAASPERARRALDAMEEQLVAEQDGIIRLLTPAFDTTSHDPGYIKGYLPGVRENGGQYTHGALWAVRALAQAGRRDRAARLLDMLSPVTHTRSPDEVAVYRTEPYVIAADVYGEPPHVGRGGWTWYTGSAGWMYRVALESILGFELRDGNRLAIRPCIPDDWPGFEIRYRIPSGTTVYTIEAHRAAAGEGAGGELDGGVLAVEDGAILIPLQDDGGEHRARVRLTEEIGPRYRQRPPETA